MASFARALNSAQIPCVLWGSAVLAVLSKDKEQLVGLLHFDSYEYVIPDDRVDDGEKVLRQLQHLSPCPERCYARSPLLAFHMHDETGAVVGLHRQSETLAFIQPLDNSLVFPGEAELPSFVLVNDEPSRPGADSGTFKVVVPKCHVMMEASLRIFARNVWKSPPDDVHLYIAMKIQEHFDAGGWLDVDQLQEPVKAFYKELRVMDFKKKTFRQWLVEFKMALGESLEEEYY